MSDAHSARLNVTAEVSDGMEHGLIFYRIGIRMADHRRAAVISNMIRPSDFIQHQIPVNPAVHSMVQIADDVMGVLSRVTHVISRFLSETCQLHTALAVHQLQLRIVLSHHGKSLKVISRIPVIGNALDHVLRRFIHDIAGTLIDPFLVVVPDIDTHMPKAVFLKRRIQEISQEGFFLLRRIFTGIPGLNGERLVLHGHETDRDTGLLIFLEITHNVVCICLIAFRLQMSASVAHTGLLHKSRRGPGR